MEHLVSTKLDAFFVKYPVIHFKTGEIVIAASDPVTYIFYVQSGLVLQRFITEDGEEVSIHMFKPGSYFPVMISLSKHENEYDFIALKDMDMHRAPVADVHLLLRDNPDLLYDLTKRFAEGIQGLAKKVVTLTFADSHAKVSSCLLYFATKMGKKQHGGTCIALPFTHADIASWIGISRETVSRHIEMLGRLGILTYKDNQIVINDMNKLEAEIHKYSRRQ